jgi:RHS repeat-associated protein
MLMPWRKYPAAGGLYRYGFNGKEKDDEVVQYDYGFRIYDPRLVRFKSVDPLTRTYPWNSPYSYAEGDMTRSIDLDGLEKYIVTYGNRLKKSRVLVLTISYIESKGEVQQNFMKPDKGSPINQRDVLVVQNNENVTGEKNEYGQKDELNEGEKAVINKGKKKIQEATSENSVFLTVEHPPAPGKTPTNALTGKEFKEPGDRSIESTGYIIGSTFSGSDRNFMFTDVIHNVNKQVNELKANGKNVDLKSMVITLTTTESHSSSVNEAKAELQKMYKGATINVVVDDKSGSLKPKNSIFNSTIHAVSK